MKNLRYSRHNHTADDLLRKVVELPLEIKDVEYNQVHLDYINVSTVLTPRLYFYQTIDGICIPLNESTEKFIIFLRQILIEAKANDFRTYAKSQSLRLGALIISSNVPMSECTEKDYEDQICKAKQIIKTLT